MRDLAEFTSRYGDLVLTGASGLNRFDLRDVALVDLCLHFSHLHAPSEPVHLLPSLLQGHLTTWLPEQAARRLFTLRQYAGNFCSRLAWRKALTAHAEVSNRAAYRVVDGFTRRRDAVSPSVIAFLDSILDARAEYSARELRLADAGHAKVTLTKNADVRTVRIPDIPLTPPRRVELPRRSVNPPVSVKWTTLLDVARRVDERESAPGFPGWMPKLNLFKRLEKVRVESLGGGFFRDGAITLDGTSHLVGMLSSGKSTLLHALLFALISPGYEKRVLILSPDTASASQLVARLHAHGFSEATVISSPRNRDEHLSMAHWNARGYPSDSTLEATAALTSSLGVACPLEGFQPLPQLANDPAAPGVLKLSEKPCHRLKQGGRSGHEGDRTCPLITSCPVHDQQSRLGTANVIAMTAPALLHMTVDKAFVAEEMSFPELFQFLADVVLIDEADSVQTHFDEECTQEKDLLSTNESAFMISSVRAVVKAIGDRTGSQYQSSANVRWIRELNRLQDSISAIYHLLLRHGDALRWITERKTFTTASIFADLLPKNPFPLEEDEVRPEERAGKLEQIAIMAGMLYGKSATGDEEDQEAVGTDSANLNDEMREAYRFLKPIQADVIDAVVDQQEGETIDRIAEAIDTGVLRMFSWRSAQPTMRRRGRSPDDRFGRPEVPTDARNRALAVLLAMLTNVCLSSFAYLVRNQAAVEDEFGLLKEDAFREARRILRHYGNLIPRPMFGSVFGLMFHQAGDSAQGGTLKLVNHLGVGRYLLTNLHGLLAYEGQAGPHVLLMSGTSWAGGNSPTASPTFDVQWPVTAILRQPDEELEALSHSRYEFVSLGHEPISISGAAPDTRRARLRQVANLLGRPAPTGTILQNKWQDLEELWAGQGLRSADRRRALLVTNNYPDAKLVANELARACGQSHSVYCLVSDQLARTGEFEREAARSGDEFHRGVNLLPRSRVEDFGRSPEGSVLVAPLGPISRGHNIVTPSGQAALSTIYFLHRPHPRPDDHSTVVGMLNRAAMDLQLKRDRPAKEPVSLSDLARWFISRGHRALNDGFALRVSYQVMSPEARAQFAWDLITSLWQTIGRGIRGGVPVYVGFIDQKFAPGRYQDPPKADTDSSSCLKQCQETLRLAIEDSADRVIAERLYSPFLEALDQLFCEQVRGKV
ncbi:hypothetical protein GPA22_02730 [Aromatoleum toluvorans]|uniref:pPIWI-RE three-gene island domain-containing protein n=1 Tax=Aromatoleum toluvorans TaxID=92002 RepID=A0ABX1PT74_9RHOO|nr:hypothetical protein [Aromatoleum toluvorans]NMG42649.1 hypothetical protein [Aromatoleum toluvorans]